MNKLLFAATAAACICSINIASAQVGNTGGANPAMGADMKHDQATSKMGDTSGSKVEPAAKVERGTKMRHEGCGAMKSMDTNKDGMISKEEFMAFHEARYEAMKKNKDGMVDMKDMPMRHHHHHKAS